MRRKQVIIRHIITECLHLVITILGLTITTHSNTIQLRVMDIITLIIIQFLIYSPQVHIRALYLELFIL